MKLYGSYIQLLLDLSIKEVELRVMLVLTIGGEDKIEKAL